MSFRKSLSDALIVSRLKNGIAEESDAVRSVRVELVEHVFLKAFVCKD